MHEHTTDKCETKLSHYGKLHFYIILFLYILLQFYIYVVFSFLSVVELSCLGVSNEKSLDLHHMSCHSPPPFQCVIYYLI